MKYRLTDHDLQKKLDELSDGDFSRQLKENEKRIYYEFKYMKCAVLWFGDGPILALEITPYMLEKVDD